MAEGGHDPSRTPSPNRNRTDPRNMYLTLPKVTTRQTHENEAVTDTETTSRLFSDGSRQHVALVQMSDPQKFKDTPAMVKNYYHGGHIHEVDTSQVDRDFMCKLLDEERPEGWRNYQGVMPGHLKFKMSAYNPRSRSGEDSRLNQDRIPDTRTSLPQSSSERPPIQAFIPELNDQSVKIQSLLARADSTYLLIKKATYLQDIRKHAEKMYSFCEQTRSAPDRNDFVEAVGEIIKQIYTGDVTNFTLQNLLETMTVVQRESRGIQLHLQRWAQQSPRMRGSQASGGARSASQDAKVAALLKSLDIEPDSDDRPSIMDRAFQPGMAFGMPTPPVNPSPLEEYEADTPVKQPPERLQRMSSWSTLPSLNLDDPPARSISGTTQRHAVLNPSPLNEDLQHLPPSPLTLQAQDLPPSGPLPRLPSLRSRSQSPSASSRPESAASSRSASPSLRRRLSDRLRSPFRSRSNTPSPKPDRRSSK